MESLIFMELASRPWPSSHLMHFFKLKATSSAAPRPACPRAHASVACTRGYLLDVPDGPIAGRRALPWALPDEPSETFMDLIQVFREMLSRGMRCSFN
jgi:hypothetical protein